MTVHDDLAAFVALLSEGLSGREGKMALRIISLQIQIADTLFTFYHPIEIELPAYHPTAHLPGLYILPLLEQPLSQPLYPP